MNKQKYDIHKTYADKLNPLYVAKNTDYDDSFSKSIDDMGYIAAITRMDDKMRRIKALLVGSTHTPMVSDESVKDTLIDLANYSLMLLTEYEIRSDSTCADNQTN